MLAVAIGDLPRNSNDIYNRYSCFDADQSKAVVYLRCKPPSQLEKSLFCLFSSEPR